MKQQIQSYFEQTFPDRQDTHVSDPERIATGWETEIFSFDVDYKRTGEPIHEDIIMRMYPSDDAYGKSAKEFAAMKSLSAAGYPVTSPPLFILIFILLIYCCAPMARPLCLTSPDLRSPMPALIWPGPWYWSALMKAQSGVKEYWVLTNIRWAPRYSR